MIVHILHILCVLSLASLTASQGYRMRGASHAPHSGARPPAMPANHLAQHPIPQTYTPQQKYRLQHVPETAEVPGQSRAEYQTSQNHPNSAYSQHHGGVGVGSPVAESYTHTNWSSQANVYPGYSTGYAGQPTSNQTSAHGQLPAHYQQQPQSVATHTEVGAPHLQRPDLQQPQSVSHQSYQQPHSQSPAQGSHVAILPIGSQQISQTHPQPHNQQYQYPQSQQAQSQHQRPSQSRHPQQYQHTQSQNPSTQHQSPQHTQTQRLYQNQQTEQTHYPPQQVHPLSQSHQQPQHIQSQQPQQPHTQHRPPQPPPQQQRNRQYYSSHSSQRGQSPHPGQPAQTSHAQTHQSPQASQPGQSTQADQPYRYASRGCVGIATLRQSSNIVHCKHRCKIVILSVTYGTNLDCPTEITSPVERLCCGWNDASDCVTVFGKTSQVTKQIQWACEQDSSCALRVDRRTMYGPLSHCTQPGYNTFRQIDFSCDCTPPDAKTTTLPTTVIPRNISVQSRIAVSIPVSTRHDPLLTNRNSSPSQHRRPSTHNQNIPLIRNRNPPITHHQSPPTNYNNQPITSHNQSPLPAHNSNPPMANHNQPPSHLNPPMSSHNQPALHANPPMTSHNQPAPHANQPIVSHNQPPPPHINPPITNHNQPPPGHSNPPITHHNQLPPPHPNPPIASHNQPPPHHRPETTSQTFTPQPPQADISTRLIPSSSVFVEVNQPTERTPIGRPLDIIVPTDISDLDPMLFDESDVINGGSEVSAASDLSSDDLGLVVGAGAGAVCVVIAILVAVLLIVRRRRRESQQKPTDEVWSLEGPDYASIDEFHMDPGRLNRGQSDTGSDPYYSSPPSPRNSIHGDSISNNTAGGADENANVLTSQQLQKQKFALKPPTKLHSGFEMINLGKSQAGKHGYFSPHSPKPPSIPDTTHTTSEYGVLYSHGPVKTIGCTRTRDRLAYDHIHKPKLSVISNGTSISNTTSLSNGTPDLPCYAQVERPPCPPRRKARDSDC